MGCCPEAAKRAEQVLDDTRDSATRDRVTSLVNSVTRKADAVEIDRRLLDDLAEIRFAKTDDPRARAATPRTLPRSGARDSIWTLVLRRWWQPQLRGAPPRGSGTGDSIGRLGGDPARWS